MRIPDLFSDVVVIAQWYKREEKSVSFVVSFDHTCLCRSLSTLSVCLSISLPVFLSVCLSHYLLSLYLAASLIVSLSVSLPNSLMRLCLCVVLPTCLSFSLPVSLPVSLSASLSVHLSDCLCVLYTKPLLLFLTVAPCCPWGLGLLASCIITEYSTYVRSDCVLSASIGRTLR